MKLVSTCSFVFGWLVALFVVACNGGGGGGDESETDTDDSSSSTASTTMSASGVDGTETMSTSGVDTTGDATDTGDDTDGDTGEDVVVCDAYPLDPPASGTCQVTGPGEQGVILRGTVLGPEETLRGGEVFYDSWGIIRCVACDCSDTPGAELAAEITCADGVISPGLVNPHEHITFAANDPIGNGFDRYEHRHQWRLGLDGHTQVFSNGGASDEEILAHELRFVMSGVTSAASAGGARGLVRNVDSFGGQSENLPANIANSDTFPLSDTNGTMLENGCDYPGSPTTAAQIANTDGYLPHISEGINLAARNEFVCLSAGETDLVEPQTAIIHGVGLLAEDARVMADDLARVVWSPRSNIVLYGNTAPVTMLDAMGVSISLGTDWVITGSMNMQRELQCAATYNETYLNGYFDDRDLWRMVTTNATFSTGTQAAIGMLRPGYLADITVFDGSGKVDHEAVVSAELADVVLVLRAGEPLYGDAPLLANAALGAGDCEAFDVCGSEKRACVERDTGFTLAQLRTAIEASYPLFFCEQPDLEPSCIPTRDEYPDGITAEDGDGDGIADAVDNCPTVFNPVRPMDEGAQADADGDDLGDNCDPCPLDAMDSCAILDANDVDGDGIRNGADNCPREPNGDQADGDDDGHGDACDPCSDQANPGPMTCALPIEALRDLTHPDHPAENSLVTVAGVYVTGVRPGFGTQQGFYVQSDSLEPYTGIFVYTGTRTPQVEIGQRVTVVGFYDEFFDLSELIASYVRIDDYAAELPFGPILFDDAAQLATASLTAEPWESMLVEVGPVNIVDANPDAPDDFDEFAVTGDLRIDDLIDTTLSNACPVDTAFASVAGITGWSFEQRKLFPRGPQDIVIVDCDPFQ